MVGTITDTSVTSGYNVSDHKDNEENKSGPDDISVHLNVPKSRKGSVASSQKTLLEKTNVKISENYTSVPYGFQLRDAYEHGKENTDIMGVIYNGRMRQFIILDARGISTWNRSIINSKVSRDMSYPKYEYGLITNIIFARKYNCYFALSKDFSLKVLNKDFEETLSVSADLRCVLFMVFNPITDQLITGGVGGTKIWNFHQVASSFGELKPMANYRLTLKAELADVGGSWVKRVELDHHLQHLYCCSDTNLYAYDLQGKLLFKFIKAHSMSITACKYSIATRFLITSSLDTEVKVWSQMGGLIHTFRGHSRAVTDTLIHPDSSYLFLTCSLDGTVRIWSLDTMDVLYSHVVSGDGVLWMGLTDDKLLYLSTVSSLTLWSLNNVYSFWGLARNKVSQLCLARGPEKTTRVMAVGDDGSVRLFARSSQRNLSTVLPPPSLSPLETILSVTYNREYNIIYMLINPQEIWLYTTRTDPACRVTIWYVNEIQNYCKSHSDGQGFNQEGSAFSQSYRSKSVHRTSISGSGNDPVVDCMCVCTLVSPAMVWTEEGMCSPLQHSYLLLGLEDGRILFMDPIVKNLKTYGVQSFKRQGSPDTT
ncbi:uncharacterized protein LOC135471707 [Liolophura sinensis]|uniref:uncharacterized protein LOC135471707 n=1 Tax=Liolophura sinensis TaxID=3198878 RepID=UPI0031590269